MVGDAYIHITIIKKSKIKSVVSTTREGRGVRASGLLYSVWSIIHLTWMGIECFELYFFDNLYVYGQWLFYILIYIIDI